LSRLPGSVADEQCECGVRLPLQKLAHQLHSEKASCARNQNEFFVIQFKTFLISRRWILWTLASNHLL
jgi:hypothetical protein